MPASRDYHIEACVENFEQAISAFQKGADRLEICSRLETEGMTPDFSFVEKVLAQMSIPIRVMIRENEEGFESDEGLMEKMKLSIEKFKSLSIEGYVIGILKNEKLDREVMEDLIAECYPLKVTVHKALDQSKNILADVGWLNQFENVDTLLTSGSKPTAMEGVEEILKMKDVFKGEVMAGGKIGVGNLEEVHRRLGLKWYHGRALV
jgi:copper homeostasis protein